MAARARPLGGRPRAAEAAPRAAAPLSAVDLLEALARLARASRRGRPAGAPKPAVAPACDPLHRARAAAARSRPAGPVPVTGGAARLDGDSPEGDGGPGTGQRQAPH